MSPAYQEIKRPRGGQSGRDKRQCFCYANVVLFAPDLLLSLYIFATYLQSCKEQICANPFFRPVREIKLLIFFIRYVKYLEQSQ